MEADASPHKVSPQFRVSVNGRQNTLVISAVWNDKRRFGETGFFHCGLKPLRPVGGTPWPLIPIAHIVDLPDVVLLGTLEPFDVIIDLIVTANAQKIIFRRF
jgi:hypothetical protein